MHRSALLEVKPKATYKLADVFAAVESDKAAYDELSKAPWSYTGPAEAMSRGLSTVLAQLNEWKAQGVSEIQSEAPFVDGNLQGAYQDTVVSQFSRGRVTPVNPA